MQLDLDQKQAEDLKSEETILRDVYAMLGCVHPERSSETTCSVDG